MACKLVVSVARGVPLSEIPLGHLARRIGSETLWLRVVGYGIRLHGWTVLCVGHSTGSYVDLGPVELEDRSG